MRWRCSASPRARDLPFPDLSIGQSSTVTRLGGRLYEILRKFVSLFLPQAYELHATLPISRHFNFSTVSLQYPPFPPSIQLSSHFQCAPVQSTSISVTDLKPDSPFPTVYLQYPLPYVAGISLRASQYFRFKPGFYTYYNSSSSILY